MANFKSGWHILYTRHQHEKKVRDNLLEQSINAYLPIKKIPKKLWDRIKYVDAPLFPSYVFVYLKTIYEYYTGLGLNGVLYYVRSGKEIARIKESLILDIRLLTEQYTDVEVSTHDFKPGQRLVIQQGALKGLDCEVVQVNGKGKILIRIHLLQRSLLFSLAENNLMGLKTN
jgi:transcription antitermination factor NusG